MEAVIKREKTARFANSLLIFLRIMIPVMLILASVLFLSGKLIIVSGSSMEPSFHDGELLLLTDNLSGISEGDIIIFKDPESENELVKRIIGIPGDTVTVSEDGIFINHEKIDDLNADITAVTLNTYDLSDTEFFVLGDNREHSRDSRFFGPVSEKSIHSKVCGPIF